jgi:hypothetical protein
MQTERRGEKITTIFNQKKESARDWKEKMILITSLSKWGSSRAVTARVK